MKEKRRIDTLQSEDREFPGNEALSTQKPHVMSFDVYFRMMQVRNPKVHAHHKAPMKHFAEHKGLSDATEEQFDEIFRSY